MRISIKKQIDSRFAAYAGTGSPGYCMAIIQGGKMLYSSAYGMASLEYDVRLTPASIFDIGSTSKQFVGMCVTLLENRGALNVDDEVRKHIGEFPRYKYPVTIRHLLHHVSGVRDYLTLMDLAGMPTENDYPIEDIIELISRQRELNFKPGDEFLYSNSGYLLLGEIVKRVSGESLGCFAEKNIFMPLGMKSTFFHDDFARIVKNKATGYAASDNGFRLDISLFDVVGDGGVNTSVEDLLLWDRNFYDNTLGGGERTIKTLLTPGRLNDGSRLDYARGLFVTNYRGRRMISHGGAWAGYRAEFIRFPGERLSIICLSNLSTANPTKVSKEIADILLDEKPPSGPDSPKGRRRGAAEMDKVPPGFYLSRDGGVVEVISRDGSESVDIGGVIYPLEPISKGVFSAGKQYEVRCKSIPPRTLSVKREGMPGGIYIHARPGEAASVRARFSPGKYSCEELGAQYEISHEAGDVVLARKGAGKEPLRIVDERTLKTSRLVLQLPVRGKKSPGFFLSAGRVKGLWFHKEE